MRNTESAFSWGAIGRLVVTGLAVLIVWKTMDILLLILVSAMLATALYPLVMKLHRKLPLSLATILVVLLLLLPFIILIASLIPSFAHELPALLATLEKILHQSNYIPPAIRNFDFTRVGENAGNYLLQSTAIVTVVITAIFTLVFLTFYLIFDAKRLTALVISIFPDEMEEKIAALLSELGRVNGQYIRGSLIKSVICGVTIFIGLTLLSVPFAAPLAIFVALLDLLPLIGPTIGMIPAIIIGLSVSPVTALAVTALFLTYQQIESAYLAPMIYNKTLNLSPALSFIAVIVGAQLYGVAGAFLALPVAASIPAIVAFVKVQREENRRKSLLQHSPS